MWRIPLINNNDVEDMLYMLQRLKAYKALKEAGIELEVPPSERPRLDGTQFFVVILKAIFHKADSFGSPYSQQTYYIRDPRLIDADISEIIKQIYDTDVAMRFVGDMPDYLHDGDVLIIAEDKVYSLVGEWTVELIRHFVKKE